MHALCFLSKSFRLSFNYIARYALSRNTKIFSIKIHKSFAKQFIEIPLKKINFISLDREKERPYLCKVTSNTRFMTKKQALQLFEQKKVRTIWDEGQEKWYFAIIDVVAVLTESVDPQSYWRKLKQRLKEEGNQTVTDCHAFKLQAVDGKMRLTDVADTEQLFRLIQSIPSPKAEPFKIWMSQVASTRLEQMQDPELSIEQAMLDYKRLGYSDSWINQRLKSIEIRKELTDEWNRTGVTENYQYATLTDIITKEWSGFKTKEYKHFKGLKKESLRDNMTNLELVLNSLAEASTTEISKEKDPLGFEENKVVAKEGGEVAKIAREQLEAKIGKSVISHRNAKDFLQLPEE